MCLVVFFFGYTSFAPPGVDKFFSNYTMLVVAPILYLFWKILKRTPFVKSHEADLIWERPIVDAYEASFVSPPIGFWLEMLQMVGIKRAKKDDRRGSIQAIVDRRGSVISTKSRE